LCTHAADGAAQVFEWVHRDAGGNEVETEVRMMALPGPGRLLRASITDIGARRRADKITAGERDVFERIAADAPLPAVLEAIVDLLESVSRSFTAAIGCLDAHGQSFAEVLGRRLPARWRALEQGLPIDVRNGSSAAAVYLGRAVLVGEIDSDPFWQRRRALALELGFRAAWAVPIRAGSGRMLGAVSIYRPIAGAPQPHDLELLVHAARLAGIAIERRQGEAALRDSEAKFRSLYERVLEGVYQCAPDGRLIEVNPAFVKMLGYAGAAQIYALPGIAALYLDPAQRAALEQALQEQGVVHNAEAVLRCQDGSRVVVLENARRICDADGQVIAYEGTMANITARKAAEQAMFAEKERAQVTLQSIGDAVITTDRDGRIDYMNPVAEQLTGWRSEAACGQKLGSVMRLLDELTAGELDNPLVRCLREGQLVHSAEHGVLVNRLGQEIAIHDSAAPIRDRSGEIAGAVVVFRDVTKERRLKRALSYQASHDALTGLINRRELDNRLTDALRSAHEGQGPHALLYMDLDQFKRVNDACGHSAGDRLLRDVTGLLQAQVRAGDTIARLGGDEFGILMQRCSAEQAARIAEAIRQSIHDYRFIWEQHTSSVGASIGVVEITADSHSVASLLSAADIACYAAKEAGRNRVHLYDALQSSGRHRDLYWVGRVTRALEQGGLELFCQPIVPTGENMRAAPPRFYELLTRLRDDDGELVLPRQFLPAAERYDVVSAIDRWALQSAVRVLQESCAAGAGADAPPVLLALNLSATALGDRGFLDFALAQFSDPAIARGLCFEVSEAAVLGNMGQAMDFMRELRHRGCRFALADFGRGLSSFRYLKTLPVDFIKIDGQCIAGVASDVVERCMVEAISQAARALGISTIAEKVESAAVFAELRRLGVELAQGLLIASPEPISLLRTAGQAADVADDPDGPVSFATAP
jgi:diguanylate cyclase (GGDEF)-like protein/PAS domain S-box-containing protein